MTTRLEKPIRRLVAIAGVDYIVELSRAGVSFRLPRSRKPMVAPIGRVLAMAVDFAEQDARRERIRAGVMRRIGQ